MPVGFIIETTNSTSPAELYGGVWEKFGMGRVIIGYDPDDTDFNWVWNDTQKIFNEGGEKEHILTISEMPSHTHTWEYNNVAGYGNGVGANGNGAFKDAGYTGGNQPHNNLQPYVVAYRWRRVA